MTPTKAQPFDTQPESDGFHGSDIARNPGAGVADSCVGHASQDQYLRDLETLERQALYPDPCFFCAMGEVVRERMEGRIG